MRERLALGIDVGSSAVRSAAVDCEGAIAASHSVRRPDSVSGVTFDPLLLWRQVVTAAQALPSKVRANLVAIGVTAHVGTVFVGEDLRPLAPGRGWADAAGVDLLVKALGDRLPNMLRETGRPVATGGAAAAILEFRRSDPVAASRIAYVLGPKDFLVARFTGSPATDRTSAAYTGLSTVRSAVWSMEMLDAVGLELHQLPVQYGATDVIGTLSAKAGDELGIAPGTPVVAGGPDGTVGATLVLGSRRQVIADIAGTTDVIVRVVDSPDDAPRSCVLNPYTLGGFTIGGATGMTGGAIAHWASLLGYPDLQTALDGLHVVARQAGAGAAGLRVDPTMSGSRFPRWLHGETGSVWGQREEHTPDHFLLAAAEGAAYVVREGIEQLDTEGLSRTTVVALAGGASRSPFLTQLRADVLGRPVFRCPESDVSLIGAASLALQGVEGEPVVSRLKGRSIDPDPRSAAAYDDLFAEWISGRRGKVG